MKKVFLLVGFMLMLFSACSKKQDAKPVNTITATISGVDEDFSINASAFIDNTTTLKSFAIQGESKSERRLRIDLKVEDKEITKGIYTYVSTDNTGSAITPANFKGIVVMQYIAGPLFKTDMHNLFLSSTNGSAPSIEITSITDSNIQGSFYCEIRNSDSAVKTVYNGKFNLQLR